MMSRYSLHLCAALLSAGTLLTHLPANAETVHTPASSERQEGWTINMKGADILDFIDQIADITGETFVVDPRVKGRVSVVSKTPLELSEVYQLFLSVLATHGFSAITQDGQVRIVPNAQAASEANSGKSAATQMETRLIQVQQGSVQELIPLIRPMVPQYGHLAAVPSANALIISDRSANINRIEELIRQLDQKGSADYSVVNLQHAWVMDAAEMLNNAILRGQAKGSSGSQVIADARTNRLMIFGPPQARAKLVSMAQLMDAPSSRSANTRVIRLRHNDAKALAETLGKISEGLQAASGAEGGGMPQNIMIRADESLNALVLYAQPEVVSTLEEIIRQLDVPRAQVMVEAAIVEVSGDITEAVGVQWAVNSGDVAGGTNFNNTGLSVGTVLSAIKNSVIPPNLPDGAIVGIGNSDFGVLITALSANSNFNLLSTPSLLTLDNQKAEILVGQNVPFQTGTFTTDAAGANNPFTTIERQDVGVKLKVIPHINEGATLRLEIDQEISSLAPVTTAASGASDLITNKRSIKSTVLAEDGQIVVLGGLIQDDITQSESKVPLLGDIPLLGGLFRSTKDVHTKRNLMVFLRPTIIRDANGLAALAGKKYSDIRIMGAEGQDQIPSPRPSPPGQLFDGQNQPASDLRPQ